MARLRPHVSIVALTVALAALILAASAAAAAVAIPRQTPPAAPLRTLTPGERDAISGYLSALVERRYPDAFARLTAGERAYFRSPGNFASIFAADRLKIETFTLLGARSGGAAGVVAVAQERVEYFDHAAQTAGSANVTVPYGIIREGGGYRVKDPFHPWKAFVPEHASAARDGIRVTLRKISFFTGRVEIALTIANVGSGFATILPYGRSTLHDETRAPYDLLETNQPSLTDRRLRLGLRLASSAQYTGALTFATPKGAPSPPKVLTLTVGPALRDGADQPFSVDLPSITVP
jgi:hypothetical protein